MRVRRPPLGPPDALRWDGDAARLLGAAAPVGVQREFPSSATRATIDHWAEHGGALDSAIIAFLKTELRAQLDAELAALA
jgi:hypothetical protein